MKANILEKLESGKVFHDFSHSEIQEIFELPLPRLMRVAANIHDRSFADDEIQMCTLMSIKTGGCKEDCSYCPQSAHHKTDVEAQRLSGFDLIMENAKAAKDSGATRFCMGAAWRSPPKKGKQFDDVIEAIKGVSSLGLEVCTTLGMLDKDQAVRLKEAGVYAYNHNLDTSPE